MCSKGNLTKGNVTKRKVTKGNVTKGKLHINPASHSGETDVN